jgi:hypothetical protein
MVDGVDLGDAPTSSICRIQPASASVPPRSTRTSASTNEKTKLWYASKNVAEEIRNRTLRR